MGSRVWKGCGNSGPQVRWLQQYKLIFLTVLEARIPKSRCQQGCIPSWGSEDELFPCLSPSCWQWWQFLAIPQLSVASLQSLLPSSYCLLCVSVFSPFLSVLNAFFQVRIPGISVGIYLWQRLLFNPQLQHSVENYIFPPIFFS